MRSQDDKTVDISIVRPTYNEGHIIADMRERIESQEVSLQL